MKPLKEGYSMLLFSTSFLSILLLSTATDTITMSQSLRDGETIVSARGTFELGFFSPDNSTSKRYLGIWYKKISITTVVWVANREIPLVDSSSVLKFTSQGTLQLLNHNDRIIWSSNSTRLVQDPVAKLLESGNFVVKDANENNPENFLWQSFDYPCDTFLPGMKIGKNLVTGMHSYLSSWKSADDPSRGDFTFGLDPRGFPQLFIKKGPHEQFRLGPWNGLRFSGSYFPPNLDYKDRFVRNQNEIYLTSEYVNRSVAVRGWLNQNGIMLQLHWNDPNQFWNLYGTSPKENCDNYAFCGPYGYCSIANSPQCGCLKGFVPKLPEHWDMADWSNGCVRRTPLECQSGEGFKKYSGVKLPDTRNSWFNESMTLEECKLVCLTNCSCMAYTNLDIRDRGSGCLLWFGDLIDIKEFTDSAQDVYIRMDSSETDASHLGQGGSNEKKRERIIVSSVLSMGIFLLGLGLTLYVWKKKKLRRQGKKRQNLDSNYTAEELELPLFDLATVANATNNFSINNKLGEGGFGSVYKGMLKDGQEIAVKRLSKNSTQGLNEFKNEVMHIAKLQHRNLVRLLGCCIQVDEKMLIYEFMPNKSLDYFIFDNTQSILLDWPMRFLIINGIAQGLLYLHRDSRLRIIHRDIKASNILLDNEMNPKISDFGLSRSFGGNETKAKTKKVVGTYGYMSPEYAIAGLYSEKSDVFSFGVLLLEVVTGKRNSRFYHPDDYSNLNGHAWRLHIEGRSSELMDASIKDSHNLAKVLRSIHVGLLCVQRCPEDRPNMSSMVLMLGSDSALPQPKQPGFFIERNLVEGNSSSNKHEQCSANEVTITVLQAR